MVGTIDITNNNIINKINSVGSLILLLNGKVDSKCLIQINELKDEYIMGSVNIITDYFLYYNKYKKSDGELEKRELKYKADKCFNLYQSFVNEENFIAKINNIMKNVKKYMNNLTPGLVSECNVILSVYNNSTINNQTGEITHDICKCSNKMEIDPVLSALICKKCGLVKELYGTVFEDDQFHNQEGVRTKHGAYDPSKHCKFWIERIQARENTEIPSNVIESIESCIKRDKIINKKNINCIQIRKYLQETHNSKYNEHVPLIKKIITGITPPQLTDYEVQIILIYFDKVIHIFEDIKPQTKTNCPYHPYFIYKIIEQIINKQHDRIRKLKILSHIHLQSRETLICNDIIWEKVCYKVPEFKYVPTDRTVHLCDN